MKDQIFSLLQRVGRSFMLPIALLPVAGLFLGIGSSLTNTTMLSAYHLTELIGPGTAIYIVLSILSSAGSVIFNNLPILFALGVAIGMAKNEKAVAALSSAVAFLVMHSTIGQLILVHGGPESMLSGATIDVVGITSLQMGVFGGIIVGLGVAALHNRFYKIELPQVFSFFGGTRFVPIISAVVYLIAGVILFYIWPPIQILINSAGQLVLESGYGGTFIYGLLERALIPFGLHHVFYMPFWQTAVGGTEMIDGQLIEGAQNIFFAELASPDITHFNVEATRFMSGKFPLMIFALPGAALAMYTCAKPEKKRSTGSLLLSAAITSMLTGITEPLEFAFLFASPVLYGIHCVFAGLSFMLMHILGVGIGMTFSGGLIDMTLFGILQGNSKTNWISILPVGIVFFILYFIIFRFMIIKFDFPTPGREKDAMPAAASGNRSTDIVRGLGGIANINEIDCCATRLRLTVYDPAAIDKQLLSSTGAAAVMVRGNAVQIVYGPKVTLILSELEDYMQQQQRTNNTPNDIIYAPCKGRVIPLKAVDDGVFSEEFIGKGAAIEPEDGIFYAPLDGKIAMVFDTRHAIVLHSPKGTEVIIHVGLDTVQLNGKPFKVFVHDGDTVKKGDKLIEADLPAIREAGHRTITPIVVTPAAKADAVIPLTEGPVKVGTAIIRVEYKEKKK